MIFQGKSENCLFGTLILKTEVYCGYVTLAFGAVPSPFDSFLVNRGLKTLHVRMKEHMKNGLAVAKFLETHPCVEKVIHPGMYHKN